MNCTTRVLPHLRERPDRLAVWTLRDARASFAEIGALAGAAQSVARRERLATGDAVLVMSPPNPTLYGTVLGLLGLGVAVVFVEPWMPIRDVEHVLERVRPKAFIGSRMAQLWALRVAAARRIPRWIHIRTIGRTSRSSPFVVTEVEPDATATITFSSGTTGLPKGVVRSHECMASLQDAIVHGDQLDELDGPALCVFPNMALLHLGTGRGSLLVPKEWTARNLDGVSALSDRLRAASLTTGPAFLIALLRRGGAAHGLRHLRRVLVGGAQTDRWILERCFELWPGTRWTHIYGGSEAEPVAKVDAREAVERSRARGFFQTLFLGGPVPVIRARPEPDGLWVSGPNVATRLDGPAPDPGVRIDDDGCRWHNMGDRICAGDHGWWYAGRVSVPPEDFALEQRLYSELRTSACFVARDPEGRMALCGEDVERRTAEADTCFSARFPEIERVLDVRIVRDRRHRARIDRRTTLRSISGREGPF